MRRSAEFVVRALAPLFGIIFGLGPPVWTADRGTEQTGEPAGKRACVLIVVGASGTDEYGAEFARWADQWESVAREAKARTIRIGPTADAKEADPDVAPSDRDGLEKAIREEVAASSGPLWIVLVGHGTYDGREAKFNLRGPDVSAKELAEWLSACERPLAVLNCASASGPFINQLSAPGRVIVTATKSGHEYHYARFGGYLAEAIGDPSHDIDKDDQVSLLEAFLVASARTAEFYEEQARLATEHALIDDNGDGLGTPAEWFRGIRVTRRASDDQAPDGLKANQLILVRSALEREMPEEVRKRRDTLELTIETLRENRGTLDPDVYDSRLEAIVLELARLYESLEPGR